MKLSEKDFVTIVKALEYQIGTKKHGENAAGFAKICKPGHDFTTNEIKTAIGIIENSRDLMIRGRKARMEAFTEMEMGYFNRQLDDFRQTLDNLRTMIQPKDFRIDYVLRNQADGTEYPNRTIIANQCTREGALRELKKLTTESIAAQDMELHVRNVQQLV